MNSHPILALIETSAPCEMCHGHDLHSPLSLAGKNKPSALAIKSVGIGPGRAVFIYWGNLTEARGEAVTSVWGLEASGREVVYDATRAELPFLPLSKHPRSLQSLRSILSLSEVGHAPSSIRGRTLGSQHSAASEQLHACHHFLVSLRRSQGWPGMQSAD